MITTIIALAFTQSLSNSEINALSYLREEEKLALDVYTELGNTWNLRIFKNISKAEAQHMSSVQQLLVEFKIPDPIANPKAGVFTNTELQKLYTSLIKQGKASEIEALKVGAFIEDKDIFDLRKANLETKNEKIKMTYKTLLQGSENHMRAFYRQLKNRSVTYKPQFISEKELSQIVESN